MGWYGEMVGGWYTEMVGSWCKEMAVTWLREVERGWCREVVRYCSREVVEDRDELGGSELEDCGSFCSAIFNLACKDRWMSSKSRMFSLYMQ